MQITEEIKTRRNSTREQALLLLEMVPLSDTENKYNLLASAAHYLNDPEVVGKWASLIAAETDTRLRNDMLYRLSDTSLQIIPDKDAFVQLLCDILGQDEGRDTVLWMLGNFSMTNTVARQQLMAFYRAHNNADTRRSILAWLLIPHKASEEDMAFFNSILPELDTADKRMLISRLLLQDKMSAEQIAQLLTPAVPAAIKELVLLYCIDRSIVPQQELSIIVRIDQNPVLRRWSIQLLAVHGISNIPALDAVMYALKSDPDVTVREAALNVFAYGLTLNQETISYLSYCLSSETNTQLTAQLLSFLAPYTAKDPALTDALFYLLRQPLQGDTAVIIYDILGRQLPYNAALLDKFITAYDQEQRDDAKAVILKAISAVSGDRTELYLQALKSPAKAIREWALQGILMIPLTPENTTAVAKAAPALLQRELHPELRRRLARKISTIPKLPEETLAVFARITDHESDQELLRVATLVQEKAIMQSGAATIDWDQWLYKADVTHEMDGIFPHIWLFYDENPEMAKKILYACMSPANSNPLYYQHVSEADILEFMITHFGIDDELITYATNHLLQGDMKQGGMFWHYMLIIKSNPSHPDIKPALWQLLEIRGANNGINLIQVDELLRIMWGETLEEQFRQRLQQQQTVNGMLPYLKYLYVNNNWSATPALLKSALQFHPAMLDEPSFKSAFGEACRNAGVDMDRLIRTTVAPPVQPVDDGPGFAD